MSEVDRPSRDEVVRLVLSGLGAGRDLDDIDRDVRRWHDDRSTFPAEILMELAADAFSATGATRADRLDIDGLADRIPSRVASARQRRAFQTPPLRPGRRVDRGRGRTRADGLVVGR